MKNLIASGNVLDYPVPNATVVASGEAILVGDLLCIAVVGGAANEIIAVQTEGIFELPKSTGANTGFAQGAKVYWDNTAKKITGTDNSGTNKHIGYGAKSAAVGDSIGQVKLLG